MRILLLAAAAATVGFGLPACSEGGEDGERAAGAAADAATGRDLSSRDTQTADLGTDDTGGERRDGGQPVGGPDPIQGQTVTVLGDGRVLIVGGQGTASSQSESWLLDLGSLRFSSGPSIQPARTNHSATLLSNGKVLIAGGTFINGRDRVDTETAFLFDPATDSFAATGSMVEAGCCHTTFLINRGPNAGRVLFLGGGKGSERILSLEIYDPATETFSRPGSALPEIRDGAAVVRLGDDRILVAGGATQVGFADLTDSALVIDINTLSVTALTETLSKPRGFLQGFMLDDGKVLILPGRDRSTDFSDCEIFDPATNRFSGGPSLPFALLRAGVVQTLDGRIWLFGGTVANQAVDSIVVFEGTSFSEQTARLSMPFSGSRADRLPDGTILLSSGQAQSGIIAGGFRLFYP